MIVGCVFLCPAKGKGKQADQSHFVMKENFKKET